MKKLLQEAAETIANRISRRVLTTKEYKNLQSKYRNLLTRGKKELPEFPEPPVKKVVLSTQMLRTFGLGYTNMSSQFCCLQKPKKWTSRITDPSEIFEIRSLSRGLPEPSEKLNLHNISSVFLAMSNP